MACGCNQLGAILNKNYIEKRRNLRSTCCESFSHLIIIFFLVYGYSLSIITHFDAISYAVVTLKVPNDIQFVLKALNLESADYNYTTPRSIFSLLRGPLVVPTLDQYIVAADFVQTTGLQYNKAISSSSAGNAFGNLFDVGTIHFAPSNDAVLSAIDYFNTTTQRFSTLTVRIHNSEQDALSYLLNHLEERTFALIVINEASPNIIDYTLRLNYSTLPDTNQIINDQTVGLDQTYQRYLISGFMTLQSKLDEWAFEYTGASNSTNQHSKGCRKPNPALIPFPTAAYDQNQFFSAVGFLLGLAMTMATLYPMSRLVKSIVEEKETKMREVMKIMGLLEWVHHFAWFLTAFILFFWIALSTTFITSTSFLRHSSKPLLFFFFFLFAMSEISMSFFIAVFFSNSKLAAIAGPVILFATLLPRFIFLSTNRYESQSDKYLASLLSPTAFSLGAGIIADYEATGIGIQFSNADVGLYSFNSALSFMLLDTLLYGFLAWYLDQVIPSEYGTPKHPLFLFLPSYWCGSCKFGRYETLENEDLLMDLPECLEAGRGRRNGQHGNGNGEGGGARDSRDFSEYSHIEQLIPEQLPLIQVRISGLQKRYPDGKFAVKGIDLAMLEGQITCLLGHNGAGKSTTISVLTGMLQPTKGNCMIWGKQLTHELPAIRQLMGICPQQNVLFPTLTVTEHLHVFGCLKGLSGRALRQAVETVITDVGLTEKRHVPSSALSGGMKRKLCLAMALIGNSKFVLLDEPTSGMDPYSRRSTWEMLQKYKQGRVVILTTHFMDEADILGDRIAIMSEGRMRCCGSSLFLKKRFGAGYLLYLSKASTACSVTAVTDMIQSHITEAVVTSSVAGEIVYQLPVTSVARFGDLFTSLKVVAESLGIGAYGISITTLEQVFIRLAQESNLKTRGGGDGGDGGDNDLEDDTENTTFAKIKASLIRGLLAVYTEICRYLCRNPNNASVSDMELVTPVNVVVNGGDNNQVVTVGPYIQQNETKSTPPTVPSITASTVSPESVSSYNTNTSVNATVSITTPTNIATISNHHYHEDVKYDEEIKYDISESSQKEIQIMPWSSPTLFIHSPLPLEGGTPVEVDTNTPLQPLSKDTITSGEDDPLGEVHQSSIELTRAPVLVQLQELLRKRFVIAKRDLKGFFFQILFPALQILLVLLILTIDINPAGKSISLNASIFGNSAEVSLSGNLSLTPLQYTLPEDATIVPAPYYVQDSDMLSDYLLQSYDTHSSGRYGAYSLQDAIFLNITVDWVWVAETLQLNNISQNSLFNLNLNSYESSNIESSIINLLNNANVSVSSNQKYRLEDLLYQTFRVNASTITLNDIINDINKALNLNISIGNISFNGDYFTPFLRALGTQQYSIPISSPYTVLHNSSSSHGIAAYTGQLVASMFEQCSPGDDAPRYTARNHPLPLTARQSIELKIIISIFASLFILIPLCYIPAAFVTFVVRERVTKSKHLQIVSSVSPYLYWMATYLWDMMLYSILAVCILCCFFIYGKAASAIFVSTAENTLAVFLLVFLYGLSCIPLCYIYSFAFENHSTAQISIMTINFMTGFVAVLAYFIMTSIPSTAALGEKLVHFFRLFPPYNVGEGFIALSTQYFETFITGVPASYLSWKVTGRNVTFMFLEAIGFFGMVLLSESEIVKGFGYALNRLRTKLSGPVPPARTEEDIDVKKERECLQEVTPGDYSLLIRNLVKTYPPSIFCGSSKHAVRGVSLGCTVGETFGLLGINGAGKTTTLGVLTGDIRATDGEAYIAGLPLTNPLTRKMIGYCPQVDPLLDLMTGYETLWFFGRIRGMEPVTLRRKIEELVLEVGLQKHAHKVCGKYSGGNKRKLSLAVALIGDPKVLFLDEPSTGMDPEARRHMWEVIAKVSRQRSVVLTTHSMEECEALCTRIGIMVSGRLQCLGSCQHLKGRFGATYQIEVRCNIQDTDNCLRQCLALIPSAHLDERHGNFFRLQVEAGLDLALIFQQLEAGKITMGILDYCVSQATLEQIFIRFAKEQEEEQGTGALNQS